MRKTEVIAICNQKGGVGKTTSTVNLGIGLVKKGKKVLLIDADPQGDLTTSLGYNDPDSLNNTLSELLMKIIYETPISEKEGVLSHNEGVDFIPSNLSLSAMEMNLVNTMNREQILNKLIANYKNDYDYVLIDCMPSLGMVTVNALTAANKVIIPVQAHYLPAKGMTQLMQTIGRVKRNTNPDIMIAGIVLTLVDHRTNHAKEVKEIIKNTYGNHIKIFESSIPIGIKAAEVSARGKSIFEYDPNGKVAKAYEDLTKEVLEYGQKQRSELYPSIDR